MKILTKNKIIEAFHFPFTEALVFSILLWTSWGLAESFYWDRISALIGPATAEKDSFIYLEAFLIYVAIAAFFGSVLYVLMRILLAVFHLHNTRVFRAATLSSILAVFFIAALVYCWNSSFRQNLPQNAGNILMGVLIIFAFILVFLLFRWSAGDDFRIRRSGTMMLSILVISIVLSFVPFPLFSSETEESNEVQSHSGYKNLMAYSYLQPLLRPEDGS